MGSGSARWWDDVIEDLSGLGSELPATARRAVCSVLDSLLADGTLDPHQTRRAKALLRALSARTVLEVATRNR
jgi:hypothetical protein